MGNGGQESACGWCKDKWGVSWQITPIVLSKAVTDPDPAVAKRGFDAMMQMKKTMSLPLRQRVAVESRQTPALSPPPVWASTSSRSQPSPSPEAAIAARPLFTSTATSRHSSPAAPAHSVQSRGIVGLLRAPAASAHRLNNRRREVPLADPTCGASFLPDVRLLH